MQAGFLHSILLQSIPTIIVLLPPICFNFTKNTSTMFTHFYLAFNAMIIMISSKIFMQRNTAMRFMAAIFTHSSFHYHSLAEAGHLPNMRTDLYAEYFIQEGTLGSAASIPKRKTLSERALASFHNPLFFRSTGVPTTDE